MVQSLGLDSLSVNRLTEIESLQFLNENFFDFRVCANQIRRNYRKTFLHRPGNGAGVHPLSGQPMH